MVCLSIYLAFQPKTRPARPFERLRLKCQCRTDSHARHHSSSEGLRGKRQNWLRSWNASKMNVSTVGKESRNLATLKKIDPSIEKICCEASHTCVYEFDSQQSKWDRYGVEVDQIAKFHSYSFHRHLNYLLTSHSTSNHFASCRHFNHKLLWRVLHSSFAEQGQASISHLTISS